MYESLEKEIKMAWLNGLVNIGSAPSMKNVNNLAYTYIF